MEPMKPANLEIVVANIGTVYQCRSSKMAIKYYNEWKRLSKSGYGRAAHEDVTLFRDGEIYREYNADCKDR